MDDILIIGTGEGVIHFRDQIEELNKTCKTLAFQIAYPNIFTIENPLNVRLDGWFWSDPEPSLPGLLYTKEILESHGEKSKKLSNFKIHLPEFQIRDYSEWRSYCGSTQLERQKGGWKKYMSALNGLDRFNVVETFPGTTTKYPEYKLLKKDIFSPNAKDRFDYHKTIFGSVPFDSDQVFPDGRYKWGMESKLSSFVLPTCHKLGARKVYFAGFGMMGGRFYNIQNQTIPAKVGNGVQFALDVIQMWSKDWKKYHGMELISVEDESWSLVKSVL